MGELFDRYVVVDWSAAARPRTGTDSIWIAVLDDRPGGRIRLTNPSTRRTAERELVALRDPVRRTLVAVDASLGYPVGSAAWFGLGGEPWRAMWTHVATHLADDESNANDRFALAAALNLRGGGAAGGGGPFWGCPAACMVAGLGRRRPLVVGLPELRLVERRLRAGGRRPASVWQLLGAGSVGSQTLTVLPVLARLLAAGSVEVWPFTTGLVAPTVPAGTTVVVETWPTAFEPDLAIHPVRDAAQVVTVANRLRATDRSGGLAAWFEPRLVAVARRAVEDEEGWILLPATPAGPGPAD